MPSRVKVLSSGRAGVFEVTVTCEMPSEIIPSNSVNVTADNVVVNNGSSTVARK